jgi:hypothetical protein
MKYAEHIDHLLLTHGISVDWRQGREGRSWRKKRHVRLSPVKTAVTYAIALHEIGHVVGEQKGLRIDREVQAWEWAEANAVEWTEPMIVRAAKSIGSYLKMCERHRSMQLPPEGHPAWRMAQWVK